MPTTSRPPSSPPHPIANAAQAAAWNGPEGANWARAPARTPGAPDVDLVRPLLDAAAIAAHHRVLDIGCGTGAATRLAARRAVSGAALGVDLSSLMVDQARAAAAAEALANADFEVGDVQVHPFPGGAFDVAVSHFGAMFFDDPAVAFANVGRALRPGGRLAFVVPQAMARCDWYVVPLDALLGHAPTAAEAPSRMFSLAEPAVIRTLLAGAGFDEVRVAPLDAALWFGADVGTAAGFFVGSGPVRGVLERRPDLDEERARQLLETALARFAGPDGVRIPGRHWLVTARRADAATDEGTPAAVTIAPGDLPGHP